jgi:DedD protein
VSVLVLVGMVCFSLLFDTQPRPIPVDVAIVIPDRDKAPTLSASPDASSQEASVVLPSGKTGGGGDRLREGDEEVIGGSMRAVKPVDAPTVPVVPAPKPAAATPAPKPPAPVVPPKPPVPPTPAVKPAETKPAESKPAAPASPAASDPLAEAARAQALLEGKPVPAPVPRPEKADGQRFIVQVGAYSEDVRAQQVRNQLERAGLKTYTHVAETAEGRRIRVRLGPFTTRADADKAAAKAKALGVSPAILTL